MVARATKPVRHAGESPTWRYSVLALVLAGSFALALALDPIRQDVGYHAFADARAVVGIANFFDVVSNLPFLLVALAGLRSCARLEPGPIRNAWTVMFVGVGLVSFGSAHYHLEPTNGTLVWDRAPMTVAFMGALVALLGEHAGTRLARLLLAPALAAGLASVAYWHWTGDLRPYLWVQLAPLLAIPAVVLLFEARYTHRRYLLWAASLYAVSKLLEHFDAAIFDGTGGLVSGHTLKHLLAAAGGYVLALMLERRGPVEGKPATPSAADGVGPCAS
jgi:hypothetical protein